MLYLGRVAAISNPLACCTLAMPVCPLPCAMLSPEQIRAELNLIRQQTAAPHNVNFFCHTPPAPDASVRPT